MLKLDLSNKSNSFELFSNHGKIIELYENAELKSLSPHSSIFLGLVNIILKFLFVNLIFSFDIIFIYLNLYIFVFLTLWNHNLNSLNISIKYFKNFFFLINLNLNSLNINKFWLFVFNWI